MGIKTTHYNAKHENGITWVLAAKDASQAKLFARNYCLKHNILGAVTLESVLTGEVFEVDFYYTPSQGAKVYGKPFVRA